MSRLGIVRSRGEEHIDDQGRLRVPVKSALSATPIRPGWKPWWVNVNLDKPIQMVVIYKREAT